MYNGSSMDGLGVMEMRACNCERRTLFLALAWDLGITDFCEPTCSYVQRVKDLAVHLLRFKFSSLLHSNFTKSAGTHPTLLGNSPHLSLTRHFPCFKPNTRQKIKMKYLPPRSPLNSSSSSGDSFDSSHAAPLSGKDSRSTNSSHGTYWDQLPAEARDALPLWQQLEQQEQAQRRKLADVEGTRRHNGGGGGLLDVLLGSFGW
jgi:hypothetical protein